MRHALSSFAQIYWDQRIAWFAKPNANFYFHGLSGVVARLFRAYLRINPKLGADAAEIFASGSLEMQRQIYDTRIKPRLWKPSMKCPLAHLRDVLPDHTVAERMARIPYLPVLRVPYYSFVGRRP